ncbi:MAG TPA: SDR family oxidoreductase [Verrucomicrobiae bacterium]|nr:SDR family oxidoreductase [Verrucomicrobiae bacterium]
MSRLEGMRVIVTGAASGIGAATAAALAARGAQVLAVDRSLESMERATAGFSPAASGRVVPCAADVTSAADCDRMVRRAEIDLGGLDALVHSAGVLRPPGGRPRPLAELDDAEYDAVVGTNLRGTFLANRAALHLLLKQRAGQIVNLASTSGVRGRPLDALYSASKAGVVALSESIAEEVRPFGVRVQVVLPDAVDTPLWKQNGALGGAPAGALPPQRVADVILFCLALPPGVACDNLVLMPLQSRARRAAARGAAAGTSNKGEP